MQAAIQSVERQKALIEKLEVRAREHEQKHLPRKVYLLRQQVDNREKAYLKSKQEFEKTKLEFETALSQLPIGVPEDTQGPNDSDRYSDNRYEELVCGCVNVDVYDDAGMGPYFVYSSLRTCCTCKLNEAKAKLVDLEKYVERERKLEQEQELKRKAMKQKRIQELEKELEQLQQDSL